MVYSNRFVLTILKNKTPQSELKNGGVLLPFNTEYEIRLRNKHNRRAVVQVYLDGENISGNGFIVGAQSYIDLERPLDVARKFKFVALDSPDAIDHGKNGPNTDKSKGVIEAHFFLEVEAPKPAIVEHHHHHHHQTWGYPNRFLRLHDFTCNDTIGGTFSSGNSATSYGVSNTNATYSTNSSLQARGMSQQTAKGMGEINSLSMFGNETDDFDAPVAASAPIAKDGCTVEGSHSSQRFSSAAISTETEATILRVVLQGADEEITFKKAFAPKIATKAPTTDTGSQQMRDLQRTAIELERKNLLLRIAQLQAEHDALNAKSQPE